jgi:DeoR/GlpR family transcriptional regulator of sugar metabolism
MNIVERRDKIIEYIKPFNSVATGELLSYFPDSPATIRRDLVFLEEQGIISRSRGYVKYIPPAQVHEISFTASEYAIAKAAAELIPQDVSICLDSGIEVVALANQLLERTDLTIFTNSILIMKTMADTNVETYGIGGRVMPRQDCLLGPDAESFVENMHVHYLFLTTTGIRGMSGLSCVTPEQANLKSAFIRAADKKVLLATAATFDKDAVRQFASFEDIDIIILDQPLHSSELTRHLEKMGITLIIAEL